MKRIAEPLIYANINSYDETEMHFSYTGEEKDEVLELT